ncbi:MAG: type II toxin-antitoxin system VapC family toxin [Deltaproteobacteria bacterium]|nr:type II toxin-antitoxin system VapC family toxin [Deltaproteobacteria bacterium]
MRVYFDTSALVPLYVPEALSSLAVERLTGAEAVYVSWLTEVEVASALALKTRTGTLSPDEARSVLRAYRSHVGSGAYEVLPVTREVFSYAGDLLRRLETPLRTLDALHLACCQRFELTLLTADDGLARSAAHFGIPYERLGPA